MTFKLIPAGAQGLVWAYCTSGKSVPEQINVQIAEPGSVVVSFVTFEVCIAAGAFRLDFMR